MREHSDDGPLAVVVKARRNRSCPGAVIVTVDCPLCGKRHEHGAKSDGTGLGDRVAHCAVWPKPEPEGYYLVDPNGVIAGMGRR